jgi:hypothetical protein
VRKGGCGRPSLKPLEAKTLRDGQATASELGPGFGLLLSAKTPAQAELGRGTLGNWDPADCLVVRGPGHAFDAGATLDRHLQPAIARKFYIHDVLLQIDLDRVMGAKAEGGSSKAESYLAR